VLSVEEASGKTVASIRQNGQAFFGNASQSGSTLTLQNNAGTCTLTPTAGATSFSCSSDERLKKNITNAGSALDRIAPFRVRDYDLKASGEHMTGVIAQEVQKTHPEMVHADDKGILSVDAPNPWVLVKAVQEQQEEIRMLQIWLICLSLAVILQTGYIAWRRRRLTVLKGL
jgi:hypothetical protein